MLFPCLILSILMGWFCAGLMVFMASCVEVPCKEAEIKPHTVGGICQHLAASLSLYEKMVWLVHYEDKDCHKVETSNAKHKDFE